MRRAHQLAESALQMTPNRDKAMDLLSELHPRDAEPVLLEYLLPEELDNDHSKMSVFSEALVSSLKLASQELPSSAVVAACQASQPHERMKNLIRAITSSESGSSDREQERCWITKHCGISS
ncbi:MAG: hypothetical protein JWM11_6214 [Planctomycetaceae bacterium]|nr:hypothetical protein [Planctomycetaceae bacterium]